MSITSAGIIIDKDVLMAGIIVCLFLGLMWLSNKD